MKVLILLALVVVAANASSHQPEGCGRAMCRMYCRYGFARDENGCFECKCNENFDHCANAPLCTMYCENGMQRGMDGCFDCRCNPNRDHCKGRAMCQMYCENGFQRGTDGCDICACASPQV